MSPHVYSRTDARESAGRSRPAFKVLVLFSVFGALAGAIWSTLGAQEPGTHAGPGGASSAPIRILVLFDGRVVDGEIEPRPGGYLVRQPTGDIVLPQETIRVTASSLTEAYEKQRDKFAFATANDHLGLAQWCYTNRLYSQARTELEAALQLEPQRSDARELRKLLEARDPGRGTVAEGATSAPIRILVLFDGRIEEGDIEERPGGYLIRKPTGDSVLPFTMIRVAASSLAEAYEKQRNNLRRPTTNDHLALARWCYENRLYPQANTELEVVLQREPERSEARELLKLVDAATSLEPGGPSIGARAATDSGDRTTGRIRTETHADFIRRIQPLLVNKCGNATCHGRASSNSFRLVNVRSGLRHQRLESDQNLTAVLAQITAEYPQQSPLLLKPQDREMPAHRGVFFGPTGDNQVQMIRDWTASAAADLVESGVVTVAAGSPANGVEVVPPERSAESPGQAPNAPVVESPETAFSRPKPKIIEIPRTASPRSNDLLKKVLDEERPDPFDPEEFNRQMHGLRNSGPAGPNATPPR